MDVSIVLVTWNSNQFLESCLDSIYSSNKLNHLRFEVILFDNNSSSFVIKKKYKNLKLIKSKINLGYSKAINLAIHNSTGECVITLNPDLILKEDTIDKLRNFLLNNNDVGLVGCKVLDFNKNYSNSTIRRFPSILISLVYLFKLHKIGFVNYYVYADRSYNNSFSVDSISGCCMMFLRKTYDLIPGFNEKYFLYFEDTQFCFDIIKLNLKVHYIADTYVLHYGGGSTSKLPLYKKKLFFYISMITFFVININRYKIFLINCILFIIILLTLIIK